MLGNPSTTWPLQKKAVEVMSAKHGTPFKQIQVIQPSREKKPTNTILEDVIKQRL
jgi:hypothetical protein